MTLLLTITTTDQTTKTATIRQPQPDEVLAVCKAQGVDLVQIQSLQIESEDFRLYLQGDDALIDFFQGAHWEKPDLDKLLTMDLPQHNQRYWDRLTTLYSTPDLCRLERECDGRIAQLAFLSGYFAARGANGCGDHGHNAGLKKGRDRSSAVRKSLGYNC